MFTLRVASCVLRVKSFTYDLCINAVIAAPPFASTLLPHATVTQS